MKQVGSAVAVFLAGVALGLYNINRWSFWFDESFTSMLIKYSYADVIARTANDVHPPLYYLILKVWAGVFGMSDIALRSMSVVFMALAAVLAYILVRRMANHKVGLLSMALVFIGPYTVRYGQEARMYGLAAFLLMLASLVLFVQVNRKRNNRSLLLWVCYALLMAAALYTHYFTFPIFVAHLLYVLHVDTNFKLRRSAALVADVMALIKQLDIRWVMANVAAVALFLPWLPTVARQLSRVNDGFWIAGVGPQSIPNTITELIMYESAFDKGRPAQFMFGVVLLGLLLVAFNWLRKKLSKAERSNLILLLGAPFTAMCVLFIYSLVPFTSSVYIFRYFTAFALLGYTGLGYSAYLLYKYSTLRYTLMYLMCIVVLMSAGVLQVHFGWGRDHISSKEGVSELNNALKPGDTVVTAGYWEFYDTYHYIDEAYPPQILKPDYKYGAETLIYGREEFTLEDYKVVQAPSGTIWYVGPANQNVLEDVPASWQFQQEIFNDNNFRIIKFSLQDSAQ